MKLTPKQLEVVSAKLKSLWRAKACPICKSESNEWMFSRTYELADFDPTGDPESERSITPVIVANCSRCATLVSFNAMQLGLIDEKGQFKEA